MTGTPQDVRAIFTEAIGKKTPEEQTAYLDAACGSDDRLRAEVESLVTAHHDAGSFLRVLLEDQESVGVNYHMPLLTEGPGMAIGRYKLLEKIGEGGMAVVYMAEQEQPIRRKVALKIIKLGMDTRQVIARFEAERQALALMDHPSIAKVLDAGATETGRPYFVMELVQGVSITQYCDQNSLSTKDRLGLFIQLCNAVQHAHQKGIIHRDIKPSNVMVTHHDGKPVPKVIDFGIAKATNQRLTEKTLFTRYAHLIGTPAYMSPEQAELSDLDIDTRTDIYSLGVLLYELLTGTTPFSEEELRKAGYIEMQRVIREQEPVKPSTRITTLGDTSTEIAKRRSSTPELLRKTLRGDLDWIVMKTLEKDRSRRYDTAGGLAEDIRRHLEHEPVLARGPGIAYRVEKFLRRHRSQVLAAVALTVFTVAAVVILSMWNRDRAQLAEAEGLKHRNILSQAREQYAKAEREAALETIKPILMSKHVGPEARLLQATILVDNRQPKEAMAVLGGLLDEKPEVAGAAHSLLARILWESGSPDAQKLEEIQEHRKQAEAMLPETAEAYFLRAMTALTVTEQLASLDKALQLDSAHYESRRLRAFTYYASRKYDRLQDDALVMTVLRPRDPLGYSLRAKAWRELGRYPEAIADYGLAIVLTPSAEPQQVDLFVQRCETFLRMGDYEHVIAEAQAGSKDAPPLQYRRFAALTALGEYDAATALFREIIAQGHESRQKLRDWCAKYVFDTLETGRSWHVSDREPGGAAFLPMIEAEETYRSLVAKGGHRLTTDGFSARWSPDGKKLAFSLGVQGYSGVAIFDPATKETDLLIVPGKDPRWSPDDKYIAFVRDCQNLRLEELLAIEGKDQERWLKDEEVWVMNSDGTAPRRLARGGWPSWGSDSEHMYYMSRVDRTLCSISLVGEDAEPRKIMMLMDSLVQPSVSPDNQRVAYPLNGLLKITDLASLTLTGEQPVPFAGWVGAAWSPTGRELCLGSKNDSDDRMGLWVYSLDKAEPLRTLAGQVTGGAWSQDGTEFAFSLGAPYFEIWAADLDPNMSAAEAFRPCLTLAEHCRKMVAFYTRRTEADPQDAYAYSSRAQYHSYLGDRAKATADMGRFSAILSGESPLEPRLGDGWNRRRVVSLPFDCQLVFSAERRVNRIPVMSIAFGQKGRCEMKLFEIPMVVASLFGVCLFSGFDAHVARADFTFGEPEKVPPDPTGMWWIGMNCLSYDGLEMYVDSTGSTGAESDWDLYVRRRASKDDEWGPMENLGTSVNSSSWEDLSSISKDGLSLYFPSLRPGGFGAYDIYMTTRATKNDPWGPAVNLGPTINSSENDRTVWISADNLELYISRQFAGYGGADIYMAKRAAPQDPWGTPENLGPIVNSPYGENYVSLSPDGLLLLFCQWFDSPLPRPGGYGASDIWMARRASIGAPWQTPVNLGAPINGPTSDFQQRFSADGRMLYFMSGRGGVYDIWRASIDPVRDINGDGTVDHEDVVLLTAHLGEAYPPCDIGPMPWGDGVVDMTDLVVLMKYTGETDTDWTDPAFNPRRDALRVPCDAILSWTSPEFVDSHDVYFGTSFDDVNNATRDDPCGVLVSEGQTETTYDPEGLLEFGLTYYWRVDSVEVVIGSLEPTIYRGPVLKFTTEAYAYPIQDVTATASNSSAGMGPEKTVDGSGLDEDDGHSTDGKQMWLSGAAQPHWIQYEFDQVYNLHELWVWNSNQAVEAFMGFGAKTVKIEYSTDGATWTTLEGVPEFARASGQVGYMANTIVSLAGVSAKYVRLTTAKGWGVMPNVGLSEVRFFYIPDRSYVQP
jgi:Tol biopolymer transport system component